MARARHLARRVAIAAIVSVALLGLTLLLLRDHPRRLVERTVADELDAEVRLGRLEIDGLGSYVLHDLSVDLERTGWNVRVFAERVSIEGALREIKIGRIESLTVLGGEIRVIRSATQEVAAGGSTEDTDDPLPLWIGRLRIGDARLVLETTSGASVLALDVDLSGFDRHARGKVRVRGADLATLPLLAFAVGPENLRALQARSPLELETTCPSLAVALRLAGDASAVIETSGDCRLPVPGRPGQWIELPTLRARFDYPSDDAPVQVDARVDLAQVATAEAVFRASLQTGMIDWTSFDSRIVDLSTLLDVIGVSLGGREHGGEATIAVRKNADRSWTMNGLLSYVPLGPAAVPVEIELDGVVAGTSASSFTVVARARANDIDGIAIEGELGRDTHGLSVNGLRARVERIPLERWLDAAAPFGFGLPPDTSIAGISTIELRANGPIDGLRLSVDVGVENARAESRVDEKGSRIALDDATLHMHLEGSMDATRTSGNVSLRGTLASSGLPPLPLSLEAAGHHAHGTISIPAASLAIDEILDVEITDAAFDTTDFEGRARVDVVRADLAPALSWFGRGEWLAGYDVAATATAGVDVEWDRRARWSAEGSLRVDDVRVSSTDFSRDGHGLETTGRFRLDGVAGVPTSARLDAECAGFELLWETLYGDWRAIRPQLTLRAVRSAESATAAWSVRTMVSLDPETSVEATIDTSVEALSFRSEIRAKDLAGLFASYVRDPLGNHYPDLRESWLAGNLSATVAGSKRFSGTLHVAGTLDLQDVGWSASDPRTQAHGLELHLPFDLMTVEDDGSFVGPPRTGRLASDRVEILGHVIPQLDAVIETRADTLRFTEALELPMYRGTVSLEGLEIFDLLGGDPHAVTSLTMRDLRLDELSAALGLPPLAGELDGALDHVRVSSSELETRGGSTVNVFGGAVELSDVVGKNVFGNYPEVSFNAEFHDIDLALATDTFEFGSMTGIARGHIRNLSLFSGVPTKFDALLETERRRGTKQTITVEAINNLAILGTGNSIGVFDRGIHQFFDRYTYEKFGIRATLADDSFLVTGTERRGQKELFLKGELPLRIDVVNVFPGRSVSFRSMVQRVNSLSLNGVKTD